MKKRIILLGATGSIGEQTLAVVRSYPQKYQITAMAVHTSIDKLPAYITEFGLEAVCVFDAHAAKIFQTIMTAQKINILLLTGLEGLCQLTHAPGMMVVNALVGSVGVLPTLEALKLDKDVALANKETLVMAGDIVMRACEKSQGQIIPVDSEHSAIWQCLENNYDKMLKQIILTASGGALREMPLNRLYDATVAEVLNHPNWKMGEKITVDCATMMNKGFEVIEAHHLFDVGYDQINVVLHRESQIHSMVEYIDGAILAHMGVSDMRIPIQYALTAPERLELFPTTAMDWSKGFNLNFQPIDNERYPALGLAYAAGRLGGSATAVLNAANEVAVAAFLQHEIRFGAIIDLVTSALHRHTVISTPTLEEVLGIDQRIRHETKKNIKILKK